MPGVKTLADARTKVALLTTVPADLSTITTTALTAGIDVSCLLAKSGTRFSATGSETIADQALCDEGNTQVFGTSNYEAAAAVFWMLDSADGGYASADNAAYEALKEKGSRVVFVLREGPEYTDAWATGDVYDAFEVITDNPQKPSETSGYIKRIIPMQVQKAALDRAVVAGI